MSEEAIKQRLYRAVNSAINLLDKPQGSYKIIRLDGNPFHIEAMREKEIRKIRVVLDQIMADDMNMVINYDKIPDIITREIWCKKFRQGDFEVREVK